MSLGESLVELLLPGSCVSCGTDYGEDGAHGLCTACASALEFFAEPRCRICSWPGVTGVCRACRRDAPAFRRLVLLGWYDGVLGEAVKAAKIAGHHVVLDRLQPELEARLPERRYDAVVALPSDHELNGRLADRLAERLAADRVDPVRRLRGARRQVGLTRRERRRNAPLAFQRRAVSVPQTVLLVDDIVTTGASLRAVAALLVEGGALTVDAVALARARGREIRARGGAILTRCGHRRNEAAQGQEQDRDGVSTEQVPDRA